MQDDAGARTALAPAPGRVLGSDPHDFAGLYIRHRSSFISHARRYLRDPRDADEVVQEAFLRLFLALPELETELQALAYCRRTITNLCIDRYRADARRPRLVALEGPTVDELAEDDTGDPVVRAEDAALVREALSRLPDLHRAALVKREIEEKPLPVIADELDIAEDNVKHLLFRARKALRKLLVGTSVAPGADVEAGRGLRSAGASSSLAGLLLLALLGLGSGPDLRAVPVVGVDLPDVLGVTAVADAVGDAVREVVRVVVTGEQAQASAPEGSSRPSSRSQGLPADDGPGGAVAPAGASPVEASAPTRTTVVPGARTAPSGSATPVVGSVAVVAPVPSGAALPGVSVTGGRPAPGTAPERDGASTSPVGARPQSGASSPGSPVGTAVGAPPVVVQPQTGPATPGAPGGTPRADGAASPSESAAKADKAQAKADRAAEKAVVRTDQDSTSAVSGRVPHVATPPQKAERAAEKAERAAEKAERAAEKADRAADQAAVKADRAADRAAVKADRAADGAPGKSAERAASAQRDLPAAAPVGAVTPTTASAP